LLALASDSVGHRRLEGGARGIDLGRGTLVAGADVQDSMTRKLKLVVDTRHLVAVALSSTRAR
jgi:hypothetical protein